MKLRFVYNMANGNWFQRLVIGKWNGKVRYPFILFRMPKEEVSDRLFRHEMQHIYQIYRDGCIGFYLKYIWYGIRHGYKTNPYEVEARARQHDPLTAEEQKIRELS